MGIGSLRGKCSSNDSDLPRNPGRNDREWVRDHVAGDLSGSIDLALPLGGVVALLSVDDSSSGCEISCRGRSSRGSCGT